jgi:hypothetical protein
VQVPCHLVVVLDGFEAFLWVDDIAEADAKFLADDNHLALGDLGV